MRVEAFGLEEELVLLLVGEADDLVFDRRAVARADGVDLPRVHRRARDVFADDAQRLRRGVGDVAADLALGNLAGAEAEGRRLGVAGLLLEARPVDGAAVEARRGSGLEPAAAQAEALERFAEENGRRLAAASGGVLLLAAVDESVEEGSGGDDDGSGEDAASVAELEADDLLAARRRFSSESRTSMTSACLMKSPGCDSSTWRIFTRYCCLSHCARGDQTAGPREVLSRRNWMPTASATSPMTPPSASTSRTRWPLAMPPMAGLQDICAMRSRLSVKSAVRRPMRAAAMAASQPACPAPTTTTSYCSVYAMSVLSVKLKRRFC